MFIVIKCFFKSNLLGDSKITPCRGFLSYVVDAFILRNLPWPVKFLVAHLRFVFILTYPVADNKFFYGLKNLRDMWSVYFV